MSRLTCHNVSFLNGKRSSPRETCIRPYGNQSIGLYSAKTGSTNLGCYNGHIKVNMKSTTGEVCLSAKNQDENDVKLCIQSIDTLQGVESRPISVLSNLNSESTFTAGDFLINGSGLSVSTEIEGLKTTIADLQTKLQTLTDLVNTTIPSIKVFADSFSNMFHVSSENDRDDEEF